MISNAPALFPGHDDAKNLVRSVSFTAACATSPVALACFRITSDTAMVDGYNAIKEIRGRGPGVQLGVRGRDLDMMTHDRSQADRRSQPQESSSMQGRWPGRLGAPDPGGACREGYASSLGSVS